MPSIFARHVLTAQGWQQNVRLDMDDGGLVQAVVEGCELGDQDEGVLVPGMTNAHSHAFQRALAGFAESRFDSDENFWSWRERMYRLAQSLDADDLLAVARWLYVEMLEAGYTHVVEFHYVHGPGGAWARVEALIQAAKDAGIGLTMVPVLYRRAGFGRTDVEGAQRLFRLGIDACLELVHRTANRVEVGAALHSLRAVGEPEAKVFLRGLPTGIPIHIHVAEQQREIVECLDATGARPIELLLNQFPVDDRWSLIHATHATTREIQDTARAGATVVVCPTTEANLGDGIFDLSEWSRAGAQLAIGSDSHISVDPADELRMLEYSVRLNEQRRLIRESSAAWNEACMAGANAAGLPGGRIEPGAPANLLSLDTSHPLMAGKTPEQMVSTYLFGPQRELVRGVWHCGIQQVHAGRHPRRDGAARAFSNLLHETGAELFRA